MTNLSPNKTAHAKAMYQVGKLSVAAIAVALQIEPISLVTLARKNGWKRKALFQDSRLKGTSLPSYRVEEIRGLYEDTNLTIDQVMIEAKCARQTIFNLARSYGWKKRNKVRKKKSAAGEPIRTGGWKNNLTAKAGKHHFNGFHGTNAVATDARSATYPPHLLSAIKLLQRNDFAVFRQGENFMVGTRIMDEDGLLAKAQRYERRAA